MAPPKVDVPERGWVTAWLKGGPQTTEQQGCFSSLGYDVGVLDGIDGPKTKAAADAFVAAWPLPDEQVRRCWQGIQTGRLMAAVMAVQGSAMPAQQVASPPQPGQAYAPQPGTSAPPGADYGDISQTTGLARTQYVEGYTRKDGTYVAPYYRSHR